MIVSTNLILWPIERQDLNKNYIWANDLELTRWAGATPLPRSSQDLEQWFRNLGLNPEQHIFAIKTHNGEYLGNIEFRGLDLRCGNAEIGILIGERSAWGKGVGTEAIRTLCNFGFGELRLHRLYARVLALNARAAHLFAKCGFTLEGTERQAYFQNGRYLDVQIWGLLEDEFHYGAAPGAVKGAANAGDGVLVANDGVLNANDGVSTPNSDNNK